MEYLKGTKTLENNDDILTEILLRLPSKYIFKFTCVSTRWNNLIIDHVFGKRYQERMGKSLRCSYPYGRLFGLVQINDKLGRCICSPFQAKHSLMLVHNEEYVRGARCGGEFFPAEKGYFITSSKDGLILCGRIPEVYYVGNPITGRWETLPPPPPPQDEYTRKAISVGLSSNEEDDSLGGKIINFRVIVATGCNLAYEDWGLPGSKVIPIETYSSRTREWRRSNLISEIPVKIRNGIAPTVSGGFFHWFTHDLNVVAYDPCSLDEEDCNDHYSKGLVAKKRIQHVVQLFKIPIYQGSKIIWRSDNRQTMWFGISSFLNYVEVYRKRGDSDEWVCISRLGSVDEMRNDIIGVTQKDIENEVSMSGDEMEDINTERQVAHMIAFIPWDPTLLVIRYWDQIHIYNCITKKVEHEVILDGDRRFTCDYWEWYPYFHSLTNSPYNLKHDHQT